MDKNISYWGACSKCLGRGKKSRRLKKKVRLVYLQKLEKFNQNNSQGIKPEKPKGHLEPCKNCMGSGLVKTDAPPVADTVHLPHIAIVGAGIGGVALAVACLHRGIPFTLFERDQNFNARAQGYGLTLQQASRAIEGFGITSLKDAVVSTKHVVHSEDGKVLGQWGLRKWMETNTKSDAKRTNIHIARQSLRQELLDQLHDSSQVKWNHQLINYETEQAGGITLNFKVGDQVVAKKTDLLVGADGIRSAVRNQLISEQRTPARYLSCIVILGICQLEDLGGLEHELLDSKTVFQSANGKERMYMMPYKKDSVMWQFSVPMQEYDAKALSESGAEALKQEAFKLANWHDPIPQIIKATSIKLISGYPVYDREILKPDMFDERLPITLIGDAAHPMSPFKGQGANQALLDALSLARSITNGCNPREDWREKGVKKSAVIAYEAEMLARSAIKVKDSADAAVFLHTDEVLKEVDAPRGRS